MGSKLKVALKQVSLVKGVLQEVLPPLEAKNPSGFLHGNRQKGRLFVLAQGYGPEPDETAALVHEAIGQAYFRDASLSVTSSLLRALRGAHRELRSQNEGVPRSRKRLAEALCLALKGSDLYFAQVGLSLAYVWQEPKLVVLDGQPSGPLLGSDEELEPVLSHQQLRAGGAIALVSGVEALDAEQVKAALSKEAGRALQELYELATAREPVSRLRLAVLQLSGKGESEPTPIRRLAQEPTESVGRTDWEALSRHHYRRFSNRVSDEDWAERESPQVGDRVVAFLEAAGGSLKRPSSRPDGGRVATLVFRLGVAILLLLSSVWGVRFWQDRAAMASAEDALSHAQQLENEAHASESIPMRRRLLAEAEQLVLQATELRGGDLQARSLQLRLQRELDELNSVLRLRRAVPLADVAAIDPRATPTQLVVQGIDIFVLDKQSDRIYKYLLADDGRSVKPDDNPVLLRGGDALGGELTVGQVAAIAWVPSGGARQHSALVALDDRGFLIEYDPYRGLAALPLYGLGGGGNVQAIAGFAGNLYLLDVGQRSLLWYPPGPDGYAKMAYNYFHPEVTVDVATATDLAVDDNVYLLYKNGRVERYFAGRSQPFTAVLPDSPVREGTALTIGTVTKSVYVVDRLGQRIVQFSREGQFIRQLRYGSLPDIFADLHDAAVDEEQGRLYVLSGQTVYLLDLPPAPS